MAQQLDNYLSLRILVTCVLFSTCCLPVACNAIEDNQKLINNFRQEYCKDDSEHMKDISKKINDKQWVKDELIRMSELDQQVREINTTVYQNCQISDKSCAKDIKDADTLCSDIDAINLRKLKIMIQKYSWFKTSEFGKDGAQAAWLIVQHAMDDIDLQIRVLFIMDHLVNMGEADAQSYALLYDRVSLNYQEIGVKQRYGSQFRFSDDRRQALLEPCEGSIEEVDARRKNLGLISVAENAKRLAEIYHVKIIGLENLKQ